jgi:hypothetical protein
VSQDEDICALLYRRVERPDHPHFC